MCHAIVFERSHFYRLKKSRIGKALIKSNGTLVYVLQTGSKSRMTTEKNLKSLPLNLDELRLKVSVFVQKLIELPGSHLIVT